MFSGSKIDQQIQLVELSIALSLQVWCDRGKLNIIHVYNIYINWHLTLMFETLLLLGLLLKKKRLAMEIYLPSRHNINVLEIKITKKMASFKEN